LSLRMMRAKMRTAHANPMLMNSERIESVYAIPATLAPVDAIPVASILFFSKNMARTATGISASRPLPIPMQTP
jgi:hypothetical protein